MSLNGQNLKKALQWIYHSHDKKEVFAKLEDVEMTNTWINVAKQYMEVINNVNNRQMPDQNDLDKWFAELEAEVDKAEVSRLAQAVIDKT